MAYKVSTEKFKLFTKTCKFWMKQFGLLDYRVQFYHEKLDESDCAMTTTCRQDRAGAITLNTQWAIPATAEELQRVALHEVMHVLISDLSDLALQRVISDMDIHIANEAIVVRLENGISDLYYDTRDKKD